MAIDKGQLEGIRLQSERVVRAYKELRGTAHNSDFTSDDFPVGKFAELFQHLKQLDRWLEDDGAERPSVLEAAGRPFSDANLCVEQAKALSSLISSDESNDTDSMKVAASMVFGLMVDADEHLNALWVALGGKSVLAYIAWCLERLVRKLHDIYVEMGSQRWEAGKRESLARRALDRLAGVRANEGDPE